MGRDELRGQAALIADALRNASSDRLHATLDGTIGDAQAFCWGALRQYDRCNDPNTLTSPRDFGLQHADLHYLLIGAQEAVSHAERVEQLLAALGSPQQLPPTRDIRERLLQMRNLLAEHRDEWVLYWRLTGRHTPHVRAIYESLGMPAIDGSIDSYEFGAEIVGGILSLRDLRIELVQLSAELDVLAERFRGTGRPAHPRRPSTGEGGAARGLCLVRHGTGSSSTPRLDCAGLIRHLGFSSRTLRPRGS